MQEVDEEGLPISLQPPEDYVLTWPFLGAGEWARSSVLSLIRTLIWSDQGPILLTSFNLTYFLRSPSPNIASLCVRPLTCESSGLTNSQSIIVSYDNNNYHPWSACYILGCAKSLHILFHLILIKLYEVDILLSISYKWRHWVSGKINNLFMATWPLGVEAGFEGQVPDLVLLPLKRPTPCSSVLASLTAALSFPPHSPVPLGNPLFFPHDRFPNP